MEGVFDKIQFLIASPDDILNNAVIEITSSKLTGENTVQDPRLGPPIPEPGKDCPTCHETSARCVGHFGYIRLNYPIFHPLFEKEIIKVLKIFCYSCFRFIRISMNGSLTAFDKITKWTDKKYFCPHCGLLQPAWSFEEKGAFIKVIFDGNKQTSSSWSPTDVRALLASLCKEDLEAIGITSWPENMIITLLPILPPCSRPSLFSEDRVNDDHLTIQYIEIIKANLAINPVAHPKEQLDKILTLIWRISVLFNNSGGKGKYNTTGKVIQGFRQRFTGKTGLPRENLMGKRVNQSGRTVIGPEPTLRIDQVAVPEKMAKVLSIRENVQYYNIKRLQKLHDEEKISLITRDGNSFSCEYKRDPLMIGDIISRQLLDGDYVLINRQPTLHFGSMIAFETVLSASKTICFNLSNAKSFNADFDGDEMNIHVPQTYEDVAELRELSSIQNHILSQRNGSANIVLVQDNILALYLMGHESWNLEKHELYDMIMYMVGENGKSIDFSYISKRMDLIDTFLPVQSGRGIISLCFPGDFSYQEGDVEFKHGVFITGVFDKTLSAHLTQLIYHLYGEKTTMMVINNLQFLSNRWLNIRGFSIGLQDCLLQNTDTYRSIKESIMECFVMAEAIESRIHHPRIREIRIQEKLNNARNVGMKIAQDGFGDDNNFNHTSKSGSKGDVFNIAQISGVLGQQYLDGSRVEKRLNNGTRVLSHYLFENNDLKSKYESRGFVRHSFLRGLDARELYLHALAGRLGVVKTSMGTSDTGYLQRRIIKLMEDCHVAYDQTVRDETGLVYQFCYGNGLDVLHSPPSTIIDSIIQRIQRLNQEVH